MRCHGYEDLNYWFGIGNEADTYKTIVDMGKFYMGERQRWCVCVCACVCVRVCVHACALGSRQV